MANEAIKLAVVGSARGGGAAQVIDACRGTAHRPVAVFDNDASLHGTPILDVPVVADSSIDAIGAHRHMFDALVIAIGGNLRERERLFHALVAAGLELTNVIDPGAQLRSGVVLGRGNVIIGGVYLGPEVTLGDNCYLIGPTVMHHHTKIGSHCYFSASSTLAGRVSVGDRVRFEMCSGAKADVRIGADCVVGMNCVVREHLEAGTVVEAPPYHVRKRDQA